jgi:hypothetical protein
MNYKIVNDEGLLKSFIEFLPDLKPHEVYYVVLLVRSKYWKSPEGEKVIPNISCDRYQIKRFVSRKDNLFQKIKALEIEEGTYTLKGLSIPNEALALYIDPNPKDLNKANAKLLMKLAHNLSTGKIDQNPVQLALTEIHKADAKKKFVHFDIDEECDFSQLGNYLNVDACTIVKTRGGYHLLINPKQIDGKYMKTWWNNLISNYPIDRNKRKTKQEEGNRMLLPMIGCNQGGYAPNIINLADEK